MATISVTVKVDNSAKITAEMRRAISQVIRKTAADCEAFAKGVVPVRTGNLKNSIQTEIESEMSASVGTNVEYSTFVEFGTTRMSARPYMTPATERVRDPFFRAMEQILA
jgi:HK97 gp10 family phage protein